MYRYEENALFLLILTVFLKGTLFLLFWNVTKMCIWKKMVKKKCEKSVPGKKIVKISVKKVYLEKTSEKKCEKSVPGKK